jgi:hypothetical protein
LIYPNPFEEAVTIQIDPELVNADYFISDVTGRIISKGIFSSEINHVDMSQFTAGNYFVTLRGIQPFTLRLIKL